MKIGFTGPFSDANFGDYAMLVNNITATNLGQVVLYTYDEIFVTSCAGRYLTACSFEVIKVGLSQSFETLSLFKEFLPDQILSHTQNLPTLRSSIQDLDALVLSGGGYLNSLWNLPHRRAKLYSILIPAIIAVEEGIQVRSSSNGFGPISCEDRQFFTQLFDYFKKSVFFYRQTHASLSNFLEDQITSNIKLNYAPDDLLFLSESIQDKVVEHSVKRAKRVHASKFIILETYMPLADIQQHLDKLDIFVNKCRSEFSFDIKFMPFYTDHGGLEQAEFLAQRYGASLLFDRSRGFLPIELAIDEISNAEMVISNRYHAVVVSLSVATPTFSILRKVIDSHQYYYEKNFGIISQVFDGCQPQSKNFIAYCFSSALNHLSHSLTEIIDYQSDLYNLNEYQVNMSRMRGLRSDMIEQVFTI
jgi:polysaccharide pyruvyl transferase WcaK-like protein